jgi:hypothetical protein
MNDLELRNRLLTLVPDLDSRLDPMILLAPRIKRRRLARLGSAVVAVTAVIGFAVVAVVAVDGGNGAPDQTVSAASGISGPGTVGHLYAGPPITGYAGVSMWVVAQGRLGGSGSPWVLLNYLSNGVSCTWSALVPASPTATVTRTIAGDCTPAPGAPQPTGPAIEGVTSPLGGVSRTLAAGAVPADVTTVRATVSTGKLLNRTVRTGASPLDPSRRYYVLDSGPNGFIGTLTYYDATGRPIGHLHVDAQLPPPLSAAQQAKATACGHHGYLFNTKAGVGQCGAAPQPWTESPAALAGFAATGALVLALPILVLWRRSRPTSTLTGQQPNS